MERRKFIKNSCIACIAGFTMVELFSNCSSTKVLPAKISNSDLIIPLSDFQIKKDGNSTFKKFVVLQHDSLQYPICVYRLNESTYSALWMMCTHQGAELQVFGDKLQCPAHGSEFSNLGRVESSPATENLRSFPVKIEHDQLKISLK